MNKKENSILWEMMVLIALYGLFLQIIGLFFVKERLLYSSGLWIGILLAIFMLISMYRVLRDGLCSPASAEKFVLRHSIIRYFAVVIIFGMVILVPLGNPISCFAGIMGLKAAAYLQPLVNRMNEKKKSKGVKL